MSATVAAAPPPAAPRRRPPSSAVAAIPPVAAPRPAAGAPPPKQADQLRWVRVGTDFSGWDTPLMALENVGIPFRHMFSCEIDPEVRKVLQATRRPETLYEDIRARNPQSTARVHLLVAGPPCQPWSSAGLNRGTADLRGVLLYESLVYVRAKRPRVVVLENVRNIISQRHRANFKDLLRMLREMDYVTSWKVLNTKDHGLPQSRARVYVVAIRRDVLVHPFRFPSRVKLRTSLADIMGGRPSASRRSPLEGLNTLAAGHVKWAREYLKRKGINPDEQPGVVDIGACKKLRACMVGISPCLTCGRAAAQRLYVTSYRRVLTMEEMMQLQGVAPARVDWAKIGTSKTKAGHIIGNAMSVNVLERVLPRALFAAGLLSRPPADRWSSKGVGGCALAAAGRAEED
ncbi:MAG: DNA cytosine methyltransferase [bacterium]|nr:DNA cytosine methyltransferase [bacterium]